jgi:hypothetical protein
MDSSLLQFNIILIVTLLFRKALVFEFVLGVSENFLCCMPVLKAKYIPLLGA